MRIRKELEVKRLSEAKTERKAMQGQLRMFADGKVIRPRSMQSSLVRSFEQVKRRPKPHKPMKSETREDEFSFFALTAPEVPNELKSKASKVIRRTLLSQSGPGKASSLPPIRGGKTEENAPGDPSFLSKKDKFKSKPK
jgi:hypothetical protein